MDDHRQHGKTINFGRPYIDFTLVHYFMGAAREGVLPEAVQMLVEVRKKEKADG